MSPRTRDLAWGILGGRMAPHCGILAAMAAALMVVTGSGCSCDPGPAFDDLTGLDIVFELDERLELSQLRLSVFLLEGAETEHVGTRLLPQEEQGLLDERETFIVLLPEDMGGLDVLLRTEGLVSGDLVTSTDDRVIKVAEQTVTVRARELKEVQVILEGGRCGTRICSYDEVCHQGSCREGCLIEDVFYLREESPEENACLYCSPVSSTDSFAHRPYGTGCGEGLFCGENGECLRGCFVEGALFEPDEPSPDDPCQVCDPDSNPRAWSPEPDGTACDIDKVCFGGLCMEGCFIEGAFHSPGALEDPPDPCRYCEPAVDVGDWTFAPAGTDCGEGRFCDGEGECARGCFIDGSFFLPGEVDDPGEPCGACRPDFSIHDWTATRSFEVATEEEEWQVPEGVGEIIVKAWGGGGGGGGGGRVVSGGAGGGGGYAQARFVLQSRTGFTIRVGGGGDGGEVNTDGGHDAGDGGGGGGYTALLREGRPLLVAAGGGGGGGASGRSGTYAPEDGALGGAGGGTGGAAGGGSWPTHGGGGAGQISDGGGGSPGGQPGMQGSGGNGGSIWGQHPTAGGLNGGGSGGRASNDDWSVGNAGGGGGGGGYRGGGGGGYAYYPRQGGGGGGGGAGWLGDDAMDGVLIVGNGSLPGNRQDSIRLEGASLGGEAGGSGSPGSRGGDGALYILYRASCE